MKQTGTFTNLAGSKVRMVSLRQSNIKDYDDDIRLEKGRTWDIALGGVLIKSSFF